jgi:hypothetical protein
VGRRHGGVVDAVEGVLIHLELEASHGGRSEGRGQQEPISLHCPREGARAGGRGEDGTWSADLQAARAGTDGAGRSCSGMVWRRRRPAGRPSGVSSLVLTGHKAAFGVQKMPAIRPVNMSNRDPFVQNLTI